MSLSTVSKTYTDTRSQSKSNELWQALSEFLPPPNEWKHLL